MTHLLREPWKDVAMDFWGTHLQRRIPSGHRVQAVQMGGGRVRHLYQCQSSNAQAGQTNPSWVSASSENGPPFNGQDFCDLSN